MKSALQLVPVQTAHDLETQRLQGAESLQSQGGEAGTLPRAPVRTPVAHTHLFLPRKRPSEPPRAAGLAATRSLPVCSHSPFSGPPHHGPKTTQVVLLPSNEGGRVPCEECAAQGGYGRERQSPTPGWDPAGEGKEALLTPALPWSEPIPRPHLSSCAHKQLWAARSGVFPT